MDEDFIAFLPDSDEEQRPGAGESKRREPAKRPKNKRAKRDTADAAGQEEESDKAQARNPNPWLKPVYSYSRRPVERLQQEIRDLVGYLSPTAEEEAARKSVLDRVASIVAKLKGPSASVLPLGSFHMGLFLPSSDIDLVVVVVAANEDTGTDGGTDTAGAAKPSEDSQALLRRLARAIGKSGLAAPNTLKVIGKARVPIIKYIDAATSYPVDISINIGSGLEGAKMMSGELKMHPALRPLTILLKHYLSLRGLKEVFSGGLGSFSLMCMLLSFLQLHPYLQLGLIREEENVGVLLMDFLELYARHINYDAVGIRLGSGYFDKASKREQWDHLSKQNSLMLSIEDPQEPTNDLAKGSFQMSAVRQALEHAFLMLCAKISQCERRPCHLLPELLWIPERTIRHRSYIRQTTSV